MKTIATAIGRLRAWAREEGHHPTGSHAGDEATREAAAAEVEIARLFETATRALLWYADERHVDQETGAHGHGVVHRYMSEPDEYDFEPDGGARAETALIEMGVPLPVVPKLLPDCSATYESLSKVLWHHVDDHARAKTYAVVSVEPLHVQGERHSAVKWVECVRYRRVVVEGGVMLAVDGEPIFNRELDDFEDRMLPVKP